MTTPDAHHRTLPAVLHALVCSLFIEGTTQGVHCEPLPTPNDARPDTVNTSQDDDSGIVVAGTANVAKDDLAGDERSWRLLVSFAS